MNAERRQPSDPVALRPQLGALLAAVLAAAYLPISLLDRSTLTADPLDSFLPLARLAQALASGDPGDWRLWLTSTLYRGFAASVLSQPLWALIPDPLLAARLTQTLFMLVSLWLIYGIGARLSGPLAGLLAALMFAALPVVAAFHGELMGDPLVWAVSLLLFRFLLLLDLRRPWHGVALGLLCGLAAGTRLLSLPYVAGGLLWVVCFRVRSRRAALGLLAAGVWALAMVGWWALAQWQQVLINLLQSSTWPASEDFSTFWHPEFVSFVWVLPSAAAAGYLAYRRRMFPGQTLWLFACWIAVPALLLLTLFHPWVRYALPLIPQCALLVAVALDRLSASWRPRRRQALVVGVALCALAPLLWQGGQWHPGRLGKLMPDRRQHRALSRVLPRVPPGELIATLDEGTIDGMIVTQQIPDRSYIRDSLLVEVRKVDDGRLARYLLQLSRADPNPPPGACGDLLGAGCWSRLFAEDPELTLLAREQDPDGFVIQLYRAAAPLPLLPQMRLVW